MRVEAARSSRPWRRWRLAPALVVLASLAGCKQPVAPPRTPAAAAGEAPRGWSEIPVTSPLFRFADVAFAGGAVLGSDGERAFVEAPIGHWRPIEIAAPVSRVFAAGRRLFALAENEEVPFLVDLTPKEAARVVPVPCRVTALAGAKATIIGACEGGAGLVLSSDSGRTFRELALSLPAPEVEGESTVWRHVAALAVTGSGEPAVAAIQVWSEVPLQWSWVHLAVRQGNGFRFAALPGVASVLGLVATDDVLTAAVLELSPDGDSEVRPRLVRMGSGMIPEPIGKPGPACAGGKRIGLIEGVLLGPREAAFRCEGTLLLTLDGGESWSAPVGLSNAVSLRGGDMRLLVRTKVWSEDRAKRSWHETRLWTRQLATRAPSGAIAVRWEPASEPPPVPAAPLAPAEALIEPAPDAN